MLEYIKYEKTRRLFMKFYGKKIMCAFLIAILMLSLSLTVSADTLFIEAESGAIKNGMLVVDANGAYSGKVIQSTERDVDESVEYTFNIENAGKYIIWARVYATHAEDNSYFFSVNGDMYNGHSLYTFDYYEDSDYEVNLDNPDNAKFIRPEYQDPLYDVWYWIPLSFRDVDEDPQTRHNVKFFDLPAGTNKLYVETREAGALIDKFIITDDLNYEPHKIDGDPETIYLAEKAAAEAAAAPAPEPAPAAEAATPAPVAVPTPAPQTSDNILFSILIFAAVCAAAIFVLKRRECK
jgi:hypothetical protein